VRRLVAAWQSADIPSIVDLLTEDAVFTMPPLPLRFVGRDEIGNFLATVPGGGRLDRFRLVPIRANRQPAFAVYYRDDDYGPFEAHAVLVIAIERDTIASLTRFTNPDLFTRFALPATFDD
jgi:RNA polymerase sigma-70 factor (ECF subfamily)